MPEPAKHERAIFEATLELTSAGERRAYLSAACGDDAELRTRIEVLLRAHEQAGDFLPEDNPNLAAASGGRAHITSTLLPVTEKPGDRIGRYKLREKIGEGGCGVVYVAEQEEPVRRRVALKVIKLGMDTRSVMARFEAERQALAIMDHPNVAKVLDAGATETGRPFFVMELVRGIKITDYCDQNKLSTRERLDLFIKVCQAIQHAHQKGLIHRDIKPSNILVTLHDGVPVPKIIDFGIAKATEGRLTELTVYTELNQFIGTPAYMSPEQAEMSGLDIDTRSDIYSLGVLLYELLTGQPPFDPKELVRRGIDEIRRTIREVEPPRPSTRLSTMIAASLSDVAHHRHTEAPKLISLIRGDLDWIVMKCLEKDRTRRYDTANGLAGDIQRHLKQEPVVARPPSTAYRFQKLVRRNKVAFAAAAMVLGALVLGLGMATWSFMRERVARVEADSGRREAEQARQREQLERQRAEQSAVRAHAATTRLEIEKAEQLFGADNSATALAHLARILRQQPTNRVVAERILSALGQRNVCLPVVAFRHDAPVTSGQFSQDGTRVVTSSEDNTARVWDSRTGQALTLGLQHGDDVLHACFSRDGRKVATASRDYTARVWDSHTGQALTGLLQHTGAVRFVEFSPDGRFVATASEDLTARIWDSVTGLPITEPLIHSNTVRRVRFSPDGNWLLSCARDHFGRVWNARTGQLRSPPMWEGNNVGYGQFAADSRQVMIGGGSGYASLWDSATGTRSKRFEHGRGTSSAALSPDESRLVTAGAHAIARIWDTADPVTPDRKPLHDLKHGDVTTTTRFSRNGRLVATGSADHTARIWSVQTGQPLTEPLNHNGSLVSVEFSPEDQRLLTVAHQNFALVWDIRSGQPLAEYFADLRRSHFAAFSWDGQWVFADADNYAHVWDRFTGQLILATTYYGYQLTGVQLSPRKEFLAVCSHYNPAEIWKLIPDGSAAGPLKIGRNVRKAAFNPNGDQVALADAGTGRVQGFDPTSYNVQVFDPNTGKPLGPILPQAQTVNSLEFSADDERLLTATGLKARIWNARTGAVEAEMQHNDAIVQARFSLDGNWVITASQDKTAAIWDWRKPREAFRVFHHAADVNWAELSRDAKLAVTVSQNSARVWDVKSGRLVSPPLNHLSGVNSARFSSDARRVITSSDDGTARIWDVQSGHALSEPLRHAGGFVTYAEFSPDGHWAVTASGQSKSPCIWEVPDVTEAVPAWLPRLAEAVAGQRFNHEGVSESVSAQELLALRADCAAGRGAGPHDLWAKWFFDSSSKRKLSPSAQLSISDIVQREIEQDTAAALARAVELCPTNARTYARLASLSLTNETLTNGARLAPSDWLSRYALKLSPDDPELWHARAEFCERLGKSVEAFEAMHRCVGFNPTNPAVWNMWGQLLEKTNRFEEAFDSYTRAIEQSGPWIDAQSMPALAYRNRARVLKRMNRLSEATADNLKAFDIRPRPAEAYANMIDLSVHYNGSVVQGWLPPFTLNRVAGNGLSDASPGLLTLQGVVFDVRGLIQLQGLALQNRGGPFQERFQERVNGIIVNQRCRRLHFLHATAWQEANGKTIGRYIVHYASGEMQEILINYGEDLGNWRGPSEATPTIAWKGQTTTSVVRLFTKTWDNPKPDLVIKQMDLVSTMTQSAPFIVAITADPISE